MKIIFLDIDGVMNSERYYDTVDRKVKGWSRFDPDAVACIKKLADEFNAKIVISSTWRFGAVQMLKDELTKSGLLKYLNKDWKTPQIYPPHRGTEIKMWIDNHPEVENYLILDDDVNMLKYQSPFHIKTDIKIGLQETHLEKARQILSGIKDATSK